MGSEKLDCLKPNSNETLRGNKFVSLIQAFLCNFKPTKERCIDNELSYLGMSLESSVGGMVLAYTICGKSY